MYNTIFEGRLIYDRNLNYFWENLNETDNETNG